MTDATDDESFLKKMKVVWLLRKKLLFSRQKYR